MNNYYIAIYDYYNKFLMEFYDLKSLAEFLKLPLKKVSYCLRNNKCILYNNHILLYNNYS